MGRARKGRVWDPTIKQSQRSSASDLRCAAGCGALHSWTLKTLQLMIIIMIPGPALPLPQPSCPGPCPTGQVVPTSKGPGRADTSRLQANLPPCRPPAWASLVIPEPGRSWQPGWEPWKEGVGSRIENWAGARAVELVPSVPGASGTMRSGARFHVSLEGSVIRVDLPPAPAGGPSHRRTKCPVGSCQKAGQHLGTR